MFEYFTNPTFGRKKRGIFGEDTYETEQGFTNKPSLGDPETSAFVAAKYPEKSEFNADWVRRREEEGRGNVFGDLQPAPTVGGGSMWGGWGKIEEDKKRAAELGANPPTTPTDLVFTPAPNVRTEVERLSPRETLENKYEQAVMTPAKKQSPAKQALFLALQAIGNITSEQNKPIQFLGDARKEYEVGKLGSELGAIQQQDAIGQQRDLRQAQINTIPIDDENRRLQIDNQRIANEERTKSSALSKLNSLKYYDPKNQAQRRLAEQAGLNPDDLQGWDDRNPVTKQVAGITYQYNRATGSFEPSNIPVEESKTMTDYKVQMPNGEVRTYKVAQKDAANFATQMYALGARLEQQDRQFQQKFKLDVKKFTQAKKEFETASSQRDRAFEALERARQTQNAQDVEKAQREYDKYDVQLQNMLSRAQKAKSDGELDDTQYNEIETFVNSKRKQ